MKIKRCPTCGCKCEVGGKTTHFYIPIVNKQLEKINKLLKEILKTITYIDKK